MLKARQLSIPTGVPEPLSEQYFVPHSGIAAACEALENGFERLAAEPQSFVFFKLVGPRGSGKSHLVSIFRHRAETLSPIAGRNSWFDETEWSDDVVRNFIAEYERLKAGGGMLVAATDEYVENPHVASRLAFAIPIALSYPTDEELSPLLKALSERRGFRLSDSDLEYLLKRLPANPLSLSAILAKIDALSLSVGKQATRAMFREAIGSAEVKDGAAGKP